VGTHEEIIQTVDAVDEGSLTHGGWTFGSRVTLVIAALCTTNEGRISVDFGWL
jgi:predicted alpha/beta-hydrolase family hydrolase